MNVLSSASSAVCAVSDASRIIAQIIPQMKRIITMTMNGPSRKGHCTLVGKKGEEQKSGRQSIVFIILLGKEG